MKRAYLLSKFARTVLKTNNVDHHRTADFPAFAAALRGKPRCHGQHGDVFTAPAILLIGNDPTEQHPLLAWQIRNNVRLHRAKLYVVNSESIKLRRQATSFAQIPAGWKANSLHFLPATTAQRCAAQAQQRQGCVDRAARQAARRAEPGHHLRIGDSRQGFRQPGRRSDWLPGAKFVCLGDYSNSRGAADMGLYPDLLPGYHPLAAASAVPRGVGEIPQHAGLDLPRHGRGGEGRQAEGALCCRIESCRRDCDIDPFAFSKSFRRRAGHVPDRNRRDGRCCAARRQCLRKIRADDQHLR